MAQRNTRLSSTVMKAADAYTEERSAHRKEDDNTDDCHDDGNDIHWGRARAISGEGHRKRTGKESQHTKAGQTPIAGTAHTTLECEYVRHGPILGLVAPNSAAVQLP
jgi:hypothetical protein